MGCEVYVLGVEGGGGGRPLCGQWSNLMSLQHVLRSTCAVLYLRTVVSKFVLVSSNPSRDFVFDRIYPRVGNGLGAGRGKIC